MLKNIEARLRLSHKALEVWKIYGLIELCIYAILLCVSFLLNYLWTLHSWVESTLYVLLIFYIVLIPLKLIVFPKIRWKYFFYEVKEDEIDIQDGIFIIKRTLIPTIKIQKLNISQGPILKKYGLATVTITTAASEETIPALPYDDAKRLRERIGKVVKVANDEKL
jgi:membrane protein YdbS with pleckstrin-like domain